MDFVSSFAFFVLFHLLLLLLLLLLHLAEGQNYMPDTCPDSFSCRNWPNNQTLRFPFSNGTYPLCGLCTVTCDGIEHPVIRLGPEGNPYFLNSISHDNSIEIMHWKFNESLSRKKCDSFNNLSFSNSPSISFTISRNITFFKCSNSSDLILEKERTDYFRDYCYNYSPCEGHIIYYKYPPESGYSRLSRGDFPRGCSLIQLPLSNSPNMAEISNNPFTLLTANFSLQLHLSPECEHCHLEKGQCIKDGEEFKCANLKMKPGGENLRLILGAGIGGAVLFLIICFCMFLKCYHNKSKYLPSRSASSDPSSKPDLEADSIYFGVPVFSYNELEEATNNFNPSKELGDGGFGTVYHGKLHDGREVAVKRLYENNCKRVAQFMNEIKILTRLRHRNLVSLYGCTSRHSRELLLVYEYIPNGTVADHLHGDRAKDGTLAWPIRMKIAIETASALTYLHASDIIHRDVKTNNILLDDSFCVKVADFGLSRLFPNDVTHVSTAPQGTPGYVDPEYHQCYQLTDKSDVYSFGVVLVELISSMPAVDISRHRHEINLANLALDRIQRAALDELIDQCLGFKSDITVQIMTTRVAELAFRCLQHEKEMRPTMEEVLDVLKEIQGGEDYRAEKTLEKNEMLKSVKPPPSPESEDVLLLKNSKLPVSQSSVADKWISSSSTTSTSE